MILIVFIWKLSLREGERRDPKYQQEHKLFVLLQKVYHYHVMDRSPTCIAAWCRGKWTNASPVLDVYTYKGKWLAETNDYIL